MGITNCPKQFLKVNGKEIIVYTVEQFQNHPQIDAIYIASHQDWVDYMKELVGKYTLSKVRSIVVGGQTGQLSIYNGLCEAEKNICSDNDIVLVHDGVRPIIDSELISSNIECTKANGNAISSAPATETVMLVNAEMSIKQVEDRSVSFHAKAPQTFRLRELIDCHRQALQDGITTFIDSCTMMNHYGKTLHIVPCSSDNIKITTPKDFYLLKALLKYRSDVIDEKSLED